MITTTDRKIQYDIAYPFATDFVIDFKYWSAGQIHAVLSFAAAADAELTLSTDFTLSAPGASGTLTKVSDWDHAAIRLTIYREMGMEQATDYRNGETVDLDILEQDFDYSAARDQQIEESIQRTMTFPITDPVADNELPPAGDRASKFLAFDAAGVPIAAVGMSGVPVTAFMETMLDDADVEEAQATLGISAFMATVLDDATAEAAKTTLNVKRGPYQISASDSPAAWKTGSDYVLGATEDASAAVQAAITAGEKEIKLAPGTFKWKTKFAPSTGVQCLLKGCGEATVLQLDPAITDYAIDIYQLATHSLVFADFMMDMSALTPAGVIVIGIRGNQYNDGTGVQREYWENIKIKIDSLVPSAASSEPKGFQLCKNMMGCSVDIKVSSTNISIVRGFQNCKQMTNCRVDIHDGSQNIPIYGMNTCTELVDCIVRLFSFTGHTYVGFQTCGKMSGCRVEATSNALGTAGTGFDSCNHLAGCGAINMKVYGFATCEHLTACYAVTCASHGFYSCIYITCSHPESNGGAGFNTCEHIVACLATSNTGWGFQTCKQCQQNYSNGNTGGQYTTSFADQSTNAVANTAAGGYNR